MTLKFGISIPNFNVSYLISSQIFLRILIDATYFSDFFIYLFHNSTLIMHYKVVFDNAIYVSS